MNDKYIIINKRLSDANYMEQGSANISDKVMKKLKEIVKDDSELKMIISLLEQEQMFGPEGGKSPQYIKKSLETSLNQHFPFTPESNDE